MEHLGKYLTTECQFKVVQATTITDRYQPSYEIGSLVKRKALNSILANA